MQTTANRDVLNSQIEETKRKPHSPSSLTINGRRELEKDGGGGSRVLKRRFKRSPELLSPRAKYNAQCEKAADKLIEKMKELGAVRENDEAFVRREILKGWKIIYLSDDHYKKVVDRLELGEQAREMGKSNRKNLMIDYVVHVQESEKPLDFLTWLKAPQGGKTKTLRGRLVSKPPVMKQKREIESSSLLGGVDAGKCRLKRGKRSRALKVEKLSEWPTMPRKDRGVCALDAKAIPDDSSLISEQALLKLVYESVDSASEQRVKGLCPTLDSLPADICPNRGYESIVVPSAQVACEIAKSNEAYAYVADQYKKYTNLAYADQVKTPAKFMSLEAWRMLPVRYLKHVKECEALNYKNEEEMKKNKQGFHIQDRIKPENFDDWLSSYKNQNMEKPEITNAVNAFEGMLMSEDYKKFRRSLKSRNEYQRVRVITAKPYL